MLALMAILAVRVHAALHALCYEIYSAARDDLDEVFRWVRPYYRSIEDQFWVLIAMGQLVL